MDNITDGQDDKSPAPNKIKLQLKKRPESISGSSQDSAKTETPIKLSVNNGLENKESINSAKKTGPKLFNELQNEKDVDKTVKLNLDAVSSKTGLDAADLDTSDFSKENLTNSVDVNSNVSNIDNNISTKPKIKLSNKPEPEIEKDNIRLNLKSTEKEEIENVKDDGIPPIQLEKKSEKVSLQFSSEPNNSTKKNISDTIKLKMSPDSKLPSFSEAFDSMENSDDIQMNQESPGIQHQLNIQNDDEEILNLNKKSKKKITTIYIIIALIILLVLIYYVATSLNVFLSLG
ncbi:MAG: hypothetical protein GY756_08515 [bacterium]|nr:hypothetical protein [bacterium]